MAVNTFSLTYKDIQSRLQGYELGRRASFVDGLIAIEAASVNARISKEGIDVADVISGTNLYEIARQIIILRVVAEVARSFTHQNPELSDARDKRAGELEKLIHRSPEAYAPSFDATKQRGSFRRRTYEQLGIKKVGVEGVFD